MPFSLDIVFVLTSSFLASFYLVRMIFYERLEFVPIQLSRGKRRRKMIPTSYGKIIIQVYCFEKDSTLTKNVYFHLIRSFYKEGVSYGVNDWNDNFVTDQRCSALITRIADKILILQGRKGVSREELETIRSRQLLLIQNLLQ